MPKTYKTLIHVLLLMLLPWVTGWLFLRDFGIATQYPDSSSYLKAEDQLRQNVVIDTTVQTPAYPVFLYFVHAVFGPGTTNIVYGQTLLTGLTYVLCYLVLTKLVNNPSRAFLFTSLLGLNINVLAFQNTILSENLSIFLVALSLYLNISLSQRFSLYKVALGLLSSFALVMVRPVFVGLPICIYGFHIFTHVLELFDSHKKKEGYRHLVFQQIGSYIVSLILVTVLLYGYIFNNFVKFEYWGISRIGDINTLGKIAQYGFLDKPDSYKDALSPENEEAFSKIKRGYILAGSDNKNPWEIMYRITWSYSPEAIADVEKLPQFMKKVIASNWITYVYKTLDLTPQIFREYPYYYTKVTFDTSSMVYRVLMITVSILRPGFYLLCGYVFIIEVFKGNKKLTQMLAFLLLIIGYVIFATAALAYSEYSRIRIPAELLMDMVIFYMISYVIDHNFVLFSPKTKKFHSK